VKQNTPFITGFSADLCGRAARKNQDLLAEKLVEIEVISEISRTSVATVLKKANLTRKTHRKKEPLQ